MTVWTLAGCTQPNFVSSNSSNPVALTSTTGSTPGTCQTGNVSNITKLTKILFVVDTSGSNVARTRDLGSQVCNPTDSDYATCAPPSDPTRSFRGGAIQNFLTEHQNMTNFQWGFQTFSGTSAHSFIGTDQSPIFTASATLMQAALTNFTNFSDVADNGATPYQEALQLAMQTITNDPDKNSAADPNYFVIMLTDGFPTDYITQNLSYNVQFFNAYITSLVAVASPGQVSLSTIYYGQINDPGAIQLLQTMAQAGSGQFANVNDTTTGINIDNVIPGSQTGCN